MINDAGLLRLMQLVSAGLPVGMYSYSQGFERAVDDGWINNASEARDWLTAIMHRSIMPTDVALLARLYDSWVNDDLAQVQYWSEQLIAYRETQELRAEDRHTGQALARLLTELGIAQAKAWQRNPDASFATLFSLAAVRWQIPKRQAALGYVWSWLDNQVLCAVKLIPLGQVAGQHLLSDLSQQIPEPLDNALQLGDQQLGGSVLGLALASSRHEMQYSRLFRS
jgi:urease accessory protein